MKQRPGIASGLLYISSTPTQPGHQGSLPFTWSAAEGDEGGEGRDDDALGLVLPLFTQHLRRGVLRKAHAVPCLRYEWRALKAVPSRAPRTWRLSHARTSRQTEPDAYLHHAVQEAAVVDG